MPLNDGTFCVLKPLGSYEAKMQVVTRKATYKDIVAWIWKTYGIHVKNNDISKAKRCCRLAHTDCTWRKAAPGYRPQPEHPDKEALIIQAFRHFGILSEGYDPKKQD